MLEDLRDMVIDGTVDDYLGLALEIVDDAIAERNRLHTRIHMLQAELGQLSEEYDRATRVVIHPTPAEIATFKAAMNQGGQGDE